MRTRSLVSLVALFAAAALLAGCSAAGGAEASSAPALELRIVTSSVQEQCTVPPLTSAGPGSACDIAGTTTYAVGEALGVMMPTSVTRAGEGAGQRVDVLFDTADRDTLAAVTGAAQGKQLALLADGRVLGAALVMEPITAGAFTFSFGTAAEADQVATALGATTPGASTTP